jgi:hypothetical protein
VFTAGLGWNESPVIRLARQPRKIEEYSVILDKLGMKLRSGFEIRSNKRANEISMPGDGFFHWIMQNST